MPDYAETTVGGAAAMSVLHGRLSAGAMGERSRSLTNLETMRDPSRWHPDEADIAAFADLVLTRPENVVDDRFAELLDQGATVTTLFIELLSDSARLLGERWVRDECSFVDVTLGLAVLHSLLHRYGERLDEELNRVPKPYSILITPIPGEDHIFAVAVVSQFFRSAGWRVSTGVGQSRPALLAEVSAEAPDIIGVAVSASDKLSDCSALIGELRDCSSNKNMKVLVGGPPFAEDAAAFHRVGADASARDAVEALEITARMAAKSHPM